MKAKAFTLFALFFVAALAAGGQPIWPMFAQDAVHNGAVPVAGQPANRIMATLVYDPHAPQERHDRLTGGQLLVHYQTPLLDGDDVYMMLKTGTYTSIKTWGTQIWNEQRLTWSNGTLNLIWTFQTDWKPVPIGTTNANPLGPGFEPEFHPALSGSYIYVPGAGGTVYKLNKSDGSVAAHINPFGTSVDATIYLAGAIAVDPAGNVYYDAVQLRHGSDSWTETSIASWLVKVTAAGAATAVPWSSITPGLPAARDRCLGVFPAGQLPWPPSPTAVPEQITCGSQRPPVNTSPAVAPDGTIYVPSVAQLTNREAWMLAINPDLTPKWQTSLRDRFMDGCNVLLPPNGAPGGCRVGATTGYDPAQNRPGGGAVYDNGTAAPVVAPDGTIFFGSDSRYNYIQGHLMRFSASGQYLGAYPFGFDATPSLYRHDGTYSLLMKDNHYGGIGGYCDDPTACPRDRTATNPAYPEQYFLTQLSPNLSVEWQFQSGNTSSCTRNPDGSITCVSDHPDGFEWCVNASAVDGNGVLYANSEDGFIYEVNQGGGLRSALFLNLAIGAAYTPIAIAPDGKVYAENFGTLFVVGQ
ncbi:MAG TPA: hypothetical protein VE075_09515 [Thermoanaerobaculia bacterium]|nr:hypothetical protein [Thermoanaerobaculia bacterium]